MLVSHLSGAEVAWEVIHRRRGNGRFRGQDSLVYEAALT